MATTLLDQTFKAAAHKVLVRAREARKSSLGAAVGVTSCTRGEGVTTVTTRLAAAATHLVLDHVLLIDSAASSPGSGQGSLVGCVQPSMVTGLSLLSAGSDSLGQQGISSLVTMIEHQRSKFDLIVVDLPPIGQSVAAWALAGVLDGIVLVIDVQRVSLRMVQQVKEDLQRSGARLLGAVLNRADGQNGFCLHPNTSVADSCEP